MKATLATLACLLTVGFLSAASVDGNNTAVVIRKEVVQSKTGYQFLCVPVNGLDIAAGEAKTVALSTMIPATLVPATTTLTLVGTVSGYESGKSVSVNEVEGVKSWSEDLLLKGGQIFWLKFAGKTSSGTGGRSAGVAVAQTTAPETLVFCGQDRARTVVEPAKGFVKEMCNDSSVAIKLSEVVENPTNLDTIMTIQSDSNEYKMYDYFGDTWYGPNSAKCNDVTIAPGEAFYYFKRYE